MLDHNMLKYTKFMPNQTSIDEQEEKIKLEDQVAQIKDERSLFGINADELFRDDLFHDTQTLFSYEFFDNNADTSLTDGYEINMFID